jgi:hypothetical protein
MFKKILLNTSLLALLASGCGGQPDTLWQVSEIVAPQPTSCLPPGTMPPDTVTMETGIQTDVGPWELYQGPSSNWYLILPETKGPNMVIQGTQADSYSFPWTITTVTTEPSPLNSVMTSTETDTITFKTSGGTLTGTWEVKNTYSCVGTDCMNVLPNCDVTSNIAGRQLDISDYKTY